MTAVETIRAARSEVKLRPTAAELLEEAQPLRIVLDASEDADAQSACQWFAEAQAAFDAGRGRSAMRYLRHALRDAEQAVVPGAAHDKEATVIPIEKIRRRVEKADKAAGPFSGPPLKA